MIDPEVRVTALSFALDACGPWRQGDLLAHQQNVLVTAEMFAVYISGGLIAAAPSPLLSIVPKSGKKEPF